MRVKPWSPSVSFIIGLLLTPVTSATAQDTPPLVNPPAEDEPERVTMANFGALVSEVDGQGEALEERFRAFETRRMSSSEINRLSADLEALQARTTRQIERLSSRAEHLAELAELDRINRVEELAETAQQAQARGCSNGKIRLCGRALGKSRQERRRRDDRDQRDEAGGLRRWSHVALDGGDAATLAGGRRHPLRPSG